MRIFFRFASPRRTVSCRILRVSSHGYFSSADTRLKRHDGTRSKLISLLVGNVRAHQFNPFLTRSAYPRYTYTRPQCSALPNHLSTFKQPFALLKLPERKTSSSLPLRASCAISSTSHTTRLYGCVETISIVATRMC
jgi:hypothetical protein